MVIKKAAPQGGMVRFGPLMVAVFINVDEALLVFLQEGSAMAAAIRIVNRCFIYLVLGKSGLFFKTPATYATIKRARQLNGSTKSPPTSTQNSYI